MNWKRRALFCSMIGLMQAYEEKFNRTIPAPAEPAPQTPKETPKTFDEVLQSKGLQRFIIEGEEIIAHHHDEAWKRYYKRHKNK